MTVFEGYVKLANGRTQLMEVTAPNRETALAMLRAYGSCQTCAAKIMPQKWSS